MNNLVLKEKQEFMGVQIPVIEGGFGEGQKVMLAKTIAEIHDIELKEINKLINNNLDEFEFEIDILDLKGNKNFEVICNHHGLYSQNAINRSSNIYLLSEQGYMALVGLMRTDRAKEIRRKLRREYFTMRSEIKENSFDISELSPELQMFNKMLQAVAKSELEQKKIKQQLNDVNHHALEAKEEASKSREEVQAIREVVTLDTNSWRKDTATIINRIATKLGGFGHIQPIREEIYNLLDNTYGVKLQSRLLNKQKKMALEGVPKYKIDKVNKLDVISDDKKLINGYVNIVGKMAIKYGVA
ncbi:ORF6N domain-containing protein [Clostridium perfringens]